MARPSRRTTPRKAAKETSLGSALDEIGFEPLGRQVKIKVGINHIRLRRAPPRNASAVGGIESKGVT